MKSSKNKIIYYVACSVDGFIAGEQDDISGFAPDGQGVREYLSDLKKYKTVHIYARICQFIRDPERIIL